MPSDSAAINSLAPATPPTSGPVLPSPPAHQTGGATLNTTSLLRDIATAVHDQVTALDQRTRVQCLDDLTTSLQGTAASELLHELSRQWGLSWVTIARLVDVSPTAVRKWRRGEAPVPVHRRSLARATVFMRMVSNALPPTADAGEWLCLPLSDRAPLAPLDLYTENALEVAFEFAAERITGRAALDRCDPEWETTYPADNFDVVVADDGIPSIVETSK